MKIAAIALTGLLLGINAPHHHSPQNTKRPNLHKSHLQKRHEKAYNSDDFFKLKIKVGNKQGNIFSRTISYKSADFPEIVRRVGGTGIYTVLNNDPSAPIFDGTFRYDGRPESRSKVEITNMGKTVSYDGKSATNTDASGVLYNSFIWGVPPAKIHAGDSWEVVIPQAWELGGAGSQTVTVVDLDDVNHTIRLKREGRSEGFYDNDIKQLDVAKDGKAIKMGITPGLSHWTGYTTFKNGFVVSDELMVTRPIKLISEGLSFSADQREYILLNEMPVSAPAVK